MKKNTYLLITVLWLALQANSQTNVTFLNTGQMYVGSNSQGTGVSLYIPDAMRHLNINGRTVQMVQNGTTELGGNFYQDASTNVFPVNAGTTYTTSTGIFRFVGSHPGVNRFITTQSVNLNTFDRGSNYLAFPAIQIGTNDSIVIPGKMGIDASSVHKYGGKSGKLILRSEVFGVKAFDASLRITSPGNSAALVDLGTVIVERDMTSYRPSNGSTQLFAFATPFKSTQLSGYFAGNWVRRPLNDGTFTHTNYIYGNKDTNPADGVIDDDQYVYLAAQKLVPAQAYFIKPRPKDYTYDQLKASAGLWYTDAPNTTAYDKGKFYFNGSVYSVTPYAEQLFADDVLFNYSVASSNLPSTVNWLVGNSYTCPISIALLKQAMENSPLYFSPYIYVYPAGSATYQTVDISGNSQAIQLGAIEEIPAMSVFMVRVSKGQAQNGSLSVGKSMLRHATVAHNTIQKAQAFSNAVNQVVFKVNPFDNENIYDLAAIGLRSDASLGSDVYDMNKAYVNDDNIFQLYTLSSAQTKLSANGLPLNADSVTLGFSPSKYGGTYVMSSQYAESLTTEGLWLLDRKAQTVADLKSGSYSFNSQAGDDPNRFLILFRKPAAYTDNNELHSNLKLIYNDRKIRIQGLESTDVGSHLNLYDTQGRVMLSVKVDSYPLMTVPVSTLCPSVYLLQLTGAHCVTSKIVVN